MFQLTGEMYLRSHEYVHYKSIMMVMMVMSAVCIFSVTPSRNKVMICRSFIYRHNCVERLTVTGVIISCQTWKRTTWVMSLYDLPKLTANNLARSSTSSASRLTYDLYWNTKDVKVPLLHGNFAIHCQSSFAFCRRRSWRWRFTGRDGSLAEVTRYFST